MKYLLAVFCPPLAVLAAGKPGQAVLNFVLCLFFYIPGLVHALCVVGEENANRRTEKIVSAIRGPQPLSVASVEELETDWDRTAIYGEVKPATVVAAEKLGNFRTQFTD